MQTATSPELAANELSDIIDYLQGRIEQERVALSRVLHDDLGGLLVSAVMDLGWAEQHLESATDLRDRLKRVRGALAAAIDLKRNLIEDLRPSLLDNFGLFAAFRWHVKHSCERAGVECTEQYPVDELRLRPEPLAGLFRLVQEMLDVVFAEQNVKAIEVSVRVAGSGLEVEVAHGHRGPEVVDVFAHLPVRMAAIQQRCGALGGRFSVERGPIGTAFRAAFPIEQMLAVAQH